MNTIYMIQLKMKYIIKLKNNIVIEKGDGTQLNPYIINMKNY